MGLIKLRGNHPDGLDPVFEAYDCLRRIYEASEIVEYEDETGDYYEQRVVLPGGQHIDPNDLNPINGLEQWLVRHMMQKIEDDV